MSDQPTSPLRRMRTFAEDVRIARGHQEHAPATAANLEPGNTSAPAAPTPTAAAVKTFDNVPAEHIPSFHELQKKTSGAAPTVVQKPVITEKTETTPRAPTVTVRAKKPTPPTPEKPKETPIVTPSSSATIITDKNTNSVGFFGSIVKALKDWWTTQQRAAVQKKTPTYAVPEVERRKGVIQKATSKTGTIFTADAETLREEIRRRATTPPPAPSHEPEISWSPNTEAGYPLLPSTTKTSTPHNITVSFKKTAVPAPLFVEPEPISLPEVPPVAAEPEQSPAATADDRRWEDAALPVYTPPPAPVVPTSIEPVVPVTPPPEPLPYIPTAEPSVLEAEATPQVTDPLPPAPRLSLGKLIPPIKATTNRLTVSITGAIILLVVLGFGAKILVGTLMDTGETVTLAPVTPLLPGATTIDYTLPTLTKESVVTAMQSAQVKGTTEIRFVDASGTLLKPTTAVSLIGFSESKNLAQTVTQARAAVAGSNRGIVIRVTDSMTALGALLTFEPQMVAALATTLAISDTSGDGFTDKTIGTVDVRVHTTSDGAENLVYGFITRDTILVTTSTASFVTFLGNR